MSKSKKQKKKVQPNRSATKRVQHDHVQDPPLSELPRTIWNIPRLLLLMLIRLYQETLAKGVPANTCRFSPTCSHYGYQAIYKYGVIKGGWLATWRVLRCNPFNRGGFDPVP
ncbi:MAG: hypothetical protein H6Q38_234 [Chloroflexi bacterium]|nr:hypothetical protein [Chloroflexota bacterium]